ncbi:MAG: electron transfer flavoprotein subunit beta/FixA family protein [Alphaproteobacteria bacterium]|nr:electron transfer flavoprotein subunit beta/FixA family protein [Alphaproteobacteria bacterium]MDC3273775.1 electron transfer flavoprotein subunit beta/FixA family protein [Alphaproteobacteria bacterium]MDG1465917.1 electron transfer flavoprotein subunit beta/FixA family protein [Alphaproteobacteria bacterium]MDG1883104.1 electron transfer flavoprotein subunit beta/FixA family protein [Alphaproteobacteria bacterium]MDG1982606.1 electron transfer flavoprotein subunit beta/FixA family protein 
MKILVPVKRVVDYNVKVRVKSDNSGVELDNVKMSMNPFDEIAVEEALRLKEKGFATEVIAISIGVSQVQETIRNALAMGADSGIFVEVNETLEPLNIAKIISSVAKKENVDLMILGKQAIDDDMNATSQMVAALLNWPQATFASKIEIVDKIVKVSREVDGGIENIEVNLPAVISTDLRLNEPRYASLPNIMKAKKKPINEIKIDELKINIKQRLDILKVEEPSKRQSGIMLKTIEELVDKLKNEAKVI